MTTRAADQIRSSWPRFLSAEQNKFRVGFLTTKVHCHQVKPTWIIKRYMDEITPHLTWTILSPLNLRE